MPSLKQKKLAQSYIQFSQIKNSSMKFFTLSKLFTNYDLTKVNSSYYTKMNIDINQLL